MRILITPCPGDTVLVPVSVTTANAVSSFLVKLNYDTAALSYIDYITLAQEVSSATVSNRLGGGQISINFVSPTTTNIRDGELIALRFIGKASTNLTWDPTGFYLDSLGFGIPTRWVNGAVQVKTTAVTNLTQRICAGESFEMGGTQYRATGQFTKRLQGVNSCDSIVNLNLTVVTPDTTRINTSICRGDAYVVGGAAFTSGGTFNVLLANSRGCDSLVVLNLTLNQTDLDTVDVTVCPNGYYVVGAQTFNTAGTYTVTMANEKGCDSVVVLNLSVRAPIQTNVSSTQCFGSTFTVGDRIFNRSGNYTVVLNTQFGCDSVVNLNLMIMPKDTTFLQQSICAGDSVGVGGQFFKQTGVFHVNLSNSLNCDSVVQLDLQVNPKDTVNISATICEGENFNVDRVNYTSSGVYQILLTNRFGCDSLVNLTLTVNPLDTTILDRAICTGQVVTVGGQSFSTTGQYNVKLVNVNGCDSLVMLNLSVSNVLMTQVDTTICFNGTYIRPGGASVTRPGTYLDTLTAQGGCDSIITSVLTIESQIITGLPKNLELSFWRCSTT